MAKKKKKEDIHQYTDAELETEIHETREKLFTMRYSHSVAPVKNPLLIRSLRRQLARLLTVERQRRTAGA
ncbi:MAG: 50S ribosomal protein L29 [Elusimicrobia bacterium]|nr:50S ribosomal protein L29 [Elusimicrobiota bacterium]MBD3412084.1 50S ribosomal protein L29 [Elusimicrobiota bacterium]